MGIDVRRGTSRFVTESSGIRTRHSFSFGAHYDPTNTGFGPLTCHDDHVLAPSSGFPDHRHQDVEIVTWVVSGSLVHRSHGGTSTLGPGQVAVQSAGSGITHSEVAGPSGCRFVQAWLRPDSSGRTPARDVAAVVVDAGRLVPLVGAGAPLAVGVAGAGLGVARLARGDRVVLPAASLVHAFVVSGAVVDGSGTLGEGDVLRATDEPPLHLTATGPAEVLVWWFGVRDSHLG